MITDGRVDLPRLGYGEEIVSTQLQTCPTIFYRRYIMEFLLFFILGVCCIGAGYSTAQLQRLGRFKQLQQSEITDEARFNAMGEFWCYKVKDKK